MGGEHLDVVGADVVCLGDAILHDVDNLGGCQTRGFLLDEEEIGVLSIADVGEVALVDSVGIGDDTATHCLAEYAGETHDGNPLGVDDVTEHVSYSDAGQLVDVTDKYQAHVDGDGLQQGIHKDDIYHRALINNERTAIQGVLVIAAIALGWIVFKKPVDGLRLLASGLTHSLGGSSRGCGEEDSQTHGLQGSDDAYARGGLARAWPSCQHHELGLYGLLDGGHLHVIVMDARSPDNLLDVHVFLKEVF